MKDERVPLRHMLDCIDNVDDYCRDGRDLPGLRKALLDLLENVKGQ